jgi:hypothetical protein
VSRVYLVADSPKMRADLGAALCARGHIVSGAALGSFDAGDVRDFAPDLFVLDLSANGASAPVRLSILRDPDLGRIPMIAVAGREEDARGYGAAAYLPRDALGRIADLLEAVLSTHGTFA